MTEDPTRCYGCRKMTLVRRGQADDGRPIYVCTNRDCGSYNIANTRASDKMPGYEQIVAKALQPGDVVRFPDTMIALEEERAGTFEVVRIWRWDATQHQVRLREVHSGRELAEAVGSVVTFWRRV